MSWAPQSEVPGHSCPPYLSRRHLFPSFPEGGKPLAGSPHQQPLSAEMRELAAPGFPRRDLARRSAGSHTHGGRPTKLGTEARSPELRETRTSATWNVQFRGLAGTRGGGGAAGAPGSGCPRTPAGSPGGWLARSCLFLIRGKWLLSPGNSFPGSFSSRGFFIFRKPAVWPPSRSHRRVICVR